MNRKLVELYLTRKIRRILREQTSGDFDFKETSPGKYSLYSVGVHVVTYKKDTWLEICDLIAETLK